MNFFLDENFPKKAAQFLEKKGDKVFDIRGTEIEGSNDSEIFKIAQTNEAVFLTTDKDFFHTIHFHHQNHYGILVVALSQPNVSQILEKLKTGIEYIRKNGVFSKCVLLTDNRIYIADK